MDRLRVLSAEAFLVEFCRDLGCSLDSSHAQR